MQQLFFSGYLPPFSAARLMLCCVLLIVLLGGCRTENSQIPTADIPESKESLIIQPVLHPSSVADSILVQKSRRRLSLFRQGKVIQRYDIALGLHPIGDKQRKGDFKTPEGLFHIDYHNPYSDFHYALHISYPDAAHRKRAAAAKANPGGDIFIHGLPNGMKSSERTRLAKDWTWGCIAVNNEEIIQLARMVPVGTPIRIVP